MRALQLIDFGKTAEFRDVAEPEPGPGEVLVRVGGAGACHSDLQLMYDFSEGMLPWSPPFTLGHENGGMDRGCRHRRDQSRGRRTRRGLRAMGLRPLQALPAGDGELLRTAGGDRGGGRRPRP